MRLHPILSALLRSKAGAILVAAQIALTIAIVSNALFVVNERRAMSHRPSGLADEASTFQIQYVGIGEIEDKSAMVQKDLETIRAIPGVVAVATTNSVPLSTSGSNYGVTLDPSRADKGTGAAAYFSDNFVKTLGVEISEGRDFLPTEIREQDNKDGRIKSDIVIITEHLAKKLWPDEKSVVGKTMYLGDGPSAQALRIIGVVRRMISSSGETVESAYQGFIFPVKYLRGDAHYVVRAEPGSVSRVMADTEKALSALRRDRVKVNLRTVSEMRDRRYRNERASATMLVAVTIGLLLVTASGIVGVASLWVSQRRKQIGIRRALGARRRDVMRYFLAENVLITTTGIVVGIGLAIGLNQYLVSKVELARLPIPYVIAGMIGAWILGLIAVFGPAWRAASVPPAVATRTA